MIFAGEARASVVAENPGFSIGEVGKALGAKWKAFSAEEKAPFEAKARDAKEKYEEAMKAYEAKRTAGGNDAGGAEPEEERPPGRQTGVRRARRSRCVAADAGAAARWRAFNLAHVGYGCGPCRVAWLAGARVMRMCADVHARVRVCACHAIVSARVSVHRCMVRVRKSLRAALIE